MNQPTSTTPRRRLRRGSAVAASFATVLALAGCSNDSKSSDDKAADTTATTASSDDSGGAPIDNAVTFTTPGMSYEVSGPLQPGVGAITLDNTDDVSHMLVVARMKDGVTVDQIETALNKSEEEAGKLFAEPDGGPPLGTPAPVGPGESTTVTSLDLKPGTYGMVCFFTDADGEPHWKMGMVGEFEVSGDKATEKPQSDGTINLDDDAITMPDGFNGSGTFEVTNSGDNPHGFSLASLDQGTKLADFAGAVGQAGATGGSVDVEGGVMAGGVDELLPGQSAYLTLDLEPGHYGYISPEDMNSPELPPQHGEFDVG